MTKSISRLAKNFINKELKKQVNFEAVAKHLNNLGYVTMFYDESSNLDVLRQYELVEFSKDKDAFTVKDDDTKIVFINKKLSVLDKLYAILHETAHILLGHLEHCRLTSNERLHEIEAETFVYEVLNYKNDGFTKAIIVCLIVLCVLIGANFTSDQNTEVYYSSGTVQAIEQTTKQAERVLVTPSGAKFHRSDCQYVKNKECKTLERIEALKKYAPCLVCEP